MRIYCIMTSLHNCQNLACKYLNAPMSGLPPRGLLLGSVQRRKGCCRDCHNRGTGQGVTAMYCLSSLC